MAARKPPTPTPAQLEAAARRLAKHGRFATLEEALADPIWRNVVRGMAGAMAERQARHQAQAMPPQAAPTPLPITRPQPTAPRTPLRRLGQAGLFDARRAAANDLEDDDDPTE